MKKLIALLQILSALALFALVAITIAGMVLMVRMNDTISVVHLLVGQIVLIACLLAIARHLIRRALTTLRSAQD